MRISVTIKLISNLFTEYAFIMPYWKYVYFKPLYWAIWLMFKETHKHRQLDRFGDKYILVTPSPQSMP